MSSKVNYAHSIVIVFFLFCFELLFFRFQACLLHCISYHVFESILNRADYQALLWNLLLSKEARGWASRRARCPRCTPQRCCPGECTLGCRGEVMIDGFLSQTRGSQQVGSAEDLYHLLKVQCDVMMQEVWSHDSSPGASMAVKQRPVVQHQIFRSVLYQDKKNINLRKTTCNAKQIQEQLLLCTSCHFQSETVCSISGCAHIPRKVHWQWWWVTVEQNEHFSPLLWIYINII